MSWERLLVRRRPSGESATPSGCNPLPPGLTSSWCVIHCPQEQEWKDSPPSLLTSHQLAPSQGVKGAQVHTDSLSGQHWRNVRALPVWAATVPVYHERLSPPLRQPQGLSAPWVQDSMGGHFSSVLLCFRVRPQVYSLLPDTTLDSSGQT